MDDPEPHLKRHLKIWPTRCSPRSKVVMISGLFLAFITQTILVYADTTPTIQLDRQAQAGRKVWLANNCQACHQIYGFGGFLGPDLTNAASRIGELKLQLQLSNGSAQMPKFDLDQTQTDDLWAYLESIDRTGVGQARNPNSRSLAAVESLAAGHTTPGPLEGLELFRMANCTACHTLFATSSVGAPDLSLTASRLSPVGISIVLEHGRPPSMPPTGFTQAQRETIQLFLVFINQHRETIISSIRDESSFSYLSSLPWWEFE